MVDETKDLFDDDDFEKDDTIEVHKVNDSKFDKAVDWCKNHKTATIIGAASTVLLSTLIGGKLFSKTNTVEVEKMPDPTIMDKYDRIPVDENVYTNFKYVLKDEYKEE